MLIQLITSGKAPVKETSSKPVHSDHLSPSQFQDPPRHQNLSQIHTTKPSAKENQALREKLERKISSSRFASSSDPVINETRVVDEKDSKNG